MSDKFEFTQNSARLVVDTALESAKTDLAMAKIRDAGGTPEEMFHAIYDTPEKIEDLGKTISIISLFTQMGLAFGLADPVKQGPEEPLDNLAFLGYFAILQKYVDSEPAKRFEEFFASAKVNGDAWHYFICENEIDGMQIQNLPGFDEDFFLAWLNMSIRPQFAINQADYDRQLEEAQKANVEPAGE